MSNEGESCAFNIKNLADTFNASIQQGIRQAVEVVYEIMERHGNSHSRSRSRCRRSPIKEPENFNDEEVGRKRPQRGDRVLIEMLLIEIATLEASR